VLEPSPGRRIVVVSPHLDDGVLSLGAAIAAWARVGARVEVLTVLACDAESTAPAGGWDRRGGFATEGEAARARRDEDRRACSLLGATARWLPFGNVDYERHGSDEEVRAAVVEAFEGADAVLVPGFPLTQPDHRWLAELLLADGMPARLGLYAEQPYASRLGRPLEPPAWLPDELRFERLRAGARARLAKWRAIRCYRSQLPLLGMRRSIHRGPHVLAWQPEAVAWTHL
jgi:LmbE family N-acetylglucosaminyl deacetylase